MAQRRAGRAGRLVEVDRPSSTATSVARPVRSFVTDAQRSGSRAAPCAATSPPARVDAGRGGRARPSRRSALSASTAGDTRRDGAPAHLVRLVVGGALRLQPRGRRRARTSTSRARRRSCRTTPIRPPTRTSRCAAASRSPRRRSPRRARASRDVVRTRVFMTDAGYAPEVMRAHGEAFGDDPAGQHRRRRRAARPALARRDRARGA